MRGLWTQGAMYEALEEAAGKIHKQKAWNDGWIAVRQIIQYDSKGFFEEISRKLFKLEKLLKPAKCSRECTCFCAEQSI